MFSRIINKFHKRQGSVETGIEDVPGIPLLRISTESRPAGLYGNDTSEVFKKILLEQKDSSLGFLYIDDQEDRSVFDEIKAHALKHQTSVRVLDLSFPEESNRYDPFKNLDPESSAGLIVNAGRINDLSSTSPVHDFYKQQVYQRLTTAFDALDESGHKMDLNGLQELFSSELMREHVLEKLNLRGSIAPLSYYKQSFDVESGDIYFQKAIDTVNDLHAFVESCSVNLPAFNLAKSLSLGETVLIKLNPDNQELNHRIMGLILKEILVRPVWFRRSSCSSSQYLLCIDNLLKYANFSTCVLAERLRAENIKLIVSFREDFPEKQDIKSCLEANIWET